MTEKYEGPERRVQPHLTDGQIEAIAEKAAGRAVELMTQGVYKSIGKSVVEKFFYIVGVLTLALYLWAKKNGWA